MTNIQRAAQHHEVMEHIEESKRGEGMKEIPLTKGYVALVDEDDYENVSKFKWFFSSRYAARSQVGFGRYGKNVVYMHRYIMDCPDEMDVDHINGNSLDNRRCNLRICSSSDNAKNKRKLKANSSGYKGVYWNKSKGKWHAQISVNNKNVFLGRFSNKDEAALAYDDAARKHYGNFAKTNF